MTTEQSVQILARDLERLQREFDAFKGQLKVRGPWVSVADAARELGKRPNAFRMWCQRHGVVIQNRFVARKDLDRAIEAKAALKKASA